MMSVSKKEIDALLQKKDIPNEAVFQNGSKKVCWGGMEILNALYDNNLDWYVEKWNVDYNFYCEACEKLKHNSKIEVFNVGRLAHGYGDPHIYILTDDETKTAIELVGGIKQYLTLGD